MFDIKVGAITFRGGPSRFADINDGFFISPNGVSGWFGGLGTDGSSSARAIGHGDHSTPVKKQARIITIDGDVFAPSFWAMERRARDLSGLGAEGGEVTVTVLSGTDALYAVGRVIGTEFDWAKGSQLHARFQLQIRCPDPHKYGLTHEFVSTGSNVQSFHYGNADAWPVFEVTGFAGGYRLVGPGGTFQVGSKSASAVDTINFSTGLLMRNGNHTTRQVSRRELWPVKPHASSQWRVQAVGTGAGTATMTLTDTYL